MPSVKLNTGASIPQLGFGTWRAKSADSTVYDAIKLGYRHIDCATAYGNQDKVGEAFTRAMKEGIVKREDLFITSKLWNKEHDDVEKALKSVLKDLQLEYLDLYLIHWPVSMNKGPSVQPPIKDTWTQMEEQVKAGRAKAIGISNFSTRKTKQLLETAKIKPAVNQVEIHPYFRNSQLIDDMNALDIHPEAYSPLGSEAPEGKTTPMQDETINQVAKKLGKGPAEVCLRWSMQKGIIVIPKATSAQHIKDNLTVLDFEIPEEDMKAIDAITEQRRSVEADMWLNKEEGPYKTREDLWDAGFPGES